MKYSLEYLNENADIVIVEYDQASQKVTKELSAGTNKEYVEPKRNEMYFCQLCESEPVRDGRIMQWCSKLATLQTESNDAYPEIEETISAGGVRDLFEELISSIPKSPQ